MEFLKLLLLAVGLVGIAFLGMAIRLILIKGGKFPNTHVSGNKYLKRNGIYCSQTQDKIEQRKAWKKVNYKSLSFAPDQKTKD
ncbi:MAG: hypothetical protein JXR31_11990 [Prolixibacteraceae bacterium]|nr:hypothetical protein [Prolixibacteraceae bacterium]MBN2774966.1 hypothetical protein [Prolixibacteraceae bacterium]